MSNSPPIVSARITPAWRNSASTVTSEAATSAPVCDAVARAPAAERPLLIATIGFVRADPPCDPSELARVPERLQVQQDDVGLWDRTPSTGADRYPEMSALFPIETKSEMPIPRRRASWIAASPSAPLCEAKATRPGGGISGPNVALRLTFGSVFTTPMQFGPIRRMPVGSA